MGARGLQRRAGAKRAPHGFRAAVSVLHRPPRRRTSTLACHVEGAPLCAEGGLEREGGGESRAGAGLKPGGAQPFTPGEHGDKKPRTHQDIDAKDWGGTRLPGMMHKKGHAEGRPGHDGVRELGVSFRVSPCQRYFAENSAGFSHEGSPAANGLGRTAQNQCVCGGKRGTLRRDGERVRGGEHLRQPSTKHSHAPLGSSPAPPWAGSAVRGVAKREKGGEAIKMRGEVRKTQTSPHADL